MVKVLFVCLGNICRSPMAEGILAHQLAEAGLSDQVAVDSAGCGGWHEGERPDHRTQQIATQYGFTLPSLARQIRPRDVLQHDYILVMDESNYQHVQNMMRSRRTDARLHFMREFDPQNPAKLPVPDPYNGSFSDFEETYTLLNRSVAGFLAHLRAEKGL